jgi:4'-phosphopantetheinyl transferase
MPQDIQFIENEHGKPSLYPYGPYPSGLFFNQSSTTDTAALVVNRTCEIGIDVETIRPIEQDLAQRFFSKADNATLSCLAGTDWLNAFFRCWICKEAVCKALGVGLSLDLSSFDVCLKSNQQLNILKFNDSIIQAKNWSLHSFSPQIGVVGAIAMKGNGKTLTIRKRSALL